MDDKQWQGRAADAEAIPDAVIDSLIRSLPVPPVSEFTRARILKLADRAERRGGLGRVAGWRAVAALPIAAALAFGLWLGSAHLVLEGRSAGLEEEGFLDAGFVAEVL